jgi:hypothetical protein
VIDRDTEAAVERWVELGDEVVDEAETRRRPIPCARCGSSAHVLGNERGALCARCYLEWGSPRRSIRRIFRPRG